MFAKDADINHKSVIKKLVEIMATRGKKSADRKEQLEMMTELSKIAEQHELGPAIKFKILYCITTFTFDYNTSISSAMKPDHWER